MKRLFATPSRDSEQRGGLFEFFFTSRRGADPYGVTLFEFVLTGRRGAVPYGVALLEFLFLNCFSM